MRLAEVNTPELVRTFLEMPLSIYKGDPNYIRPLDQDVERVFDKKQNKYWRHGDAIRWVMFDGGGKAIGRVAAFINNRTANTFKQPTGGMGFFECINDQKAADFLFDTCKEWLKAKGMEAMDGPINFGDRDNWWGLLAEGFIPPTYQMPYNPPYYETLFRNYGFDVYYKQYVLYRNLQDSVQPKFEEKYAKVMSMPGYRFDHLKRNNLEKYAMDFVTVYNEAWGKHPGFREMTKEVAYSLMKKAKPILAEELIWFGYHNDRPIAFFFMLPDLNPVIKNFNGKFGLWQKIQVFLKLRYGRPTKCFGVLFGVVPEYQGLGVDGGIIKASGLVLHPQKQWTDMEMNWIGDFNPKMLNVATGIGGEIIKTYYTMRYLFDRSKPFERAPIIH